MRYDKNKKAEASPQTRDEAERIARATQRPGQTKEQTRLIAQGIQKGIEEYKKQQKARARAADKARKQPPRQHEQGPGKDADTGSPESSPAGSRLPWWLLGLSWAGFVLYWWLHRP
ncbi:DUF2956 domain-containing protein [Zobellella endophytica]|uniref:DUF2956 domain-containing protein n=2 Tax=Zobellella endophytica TaxID=2116700 RepID=A0A2P7R3G1_9GAMM|nr:DUF2956 domain-containing protein [Zobellella endophytica]PSJ44771.1 DUF2956 domain-containing protein [Zobellella endophytica]